MSNGFGAAFGGLLLLAVLSGGAGLLALAGGAVAVNGRTGGVPAWLRYLIYALLAGVVVVAGFGAVALADEAPLLAAVFVALVFVPLAGGGLYLHRVTAAARRDTIAPTGLAWSLPFLLGVGVTFAIPVAVTTTFDLSVGVARELGVYRGAVVVGCVVVLLGTLWLGRRVTPFFTVSSPE